MAARPDERYTIRRQFFRFFGAGFHVYDETGVLVGYCDQKRFKLREDLRLYTDESKSEELLRIGTEQVIDFGATYTVSVPPDGDHPGGAIGSFRRKGMKSFIRDEWLVFDGSEQPLGMIREDSQIKAIIRRVHEFAAMLTPQGYHLLDESGQEIVTYQTHFNPLVHRLGVAIREGGDERIDDLLALAGGVLLLAIEGRQD
jgi:hypothetical protein